MSLSSWLSRVSRSVISQVVLTSDSEFGFLADTAFEFISLVSRCHSFTRSCLRFSLLMVLLQMWYEFSDFSILPIFSASVRFMLTVRQFFSLVLFLLLYCCVPNLAVRCLLSSRLVEIVEIQGGLVDPGLFSWVSKCLWFDWLSCRSR